MSQLGSINIDTLQLDADGNLAVDSNGANIVVGSATYPFDYRGMKLINKQPIDGVKSFCIREENGMFASTINTCHLLGQYETLPMAVGAVIGAFFNSGAGSITTVENVMSYQISLGRSCPIPSNNLPVDLEQFSLGKSPTDGLESFYWADQEDKTSGRTPDNYMAQVTSQIANGHAGSVMIYPDSGGPGGIIGTNPTESWRDFDLLQWNGTSPLPQMVTSQYLAAVRSYANDGYIATAEGVNFCFDWESGSLSTASLGSIYWNDTTNPQYRAALTELRAQQEAICVACQAEFPNSYFGMYGGSADVSQSQLKWDGSAFVVGASTDIRWLGLCNATQRAAVSQNFADALAAADPSWDFVTKIAYDNFGPGTFQEFIDNPAADATALTPTLDKDELTWGFEVLKAHFTDTPVLAIISPTNQAIASFGTSYNDTDPYALATAAVWVEQTLDFIRGADGYLIWDGFRIDTLRQLQVNYRNWNDIPLALQATWQLRFNTILDLEAKFGVLTEYAANYGDSVITTAQQWFNQDKGTRRNTDYTRNLLLRDTVAQLRDVIVPLSVEFQSTGVLPFVLKSTPTITGTASVGSVLTANTDYVGDNIDIRYRWRVDGNNVTGSSGNQSTYTVVTGDQGKEISCRVQFKRDGVTISDNTVVGPTIPAPDFASVTNIAPGIVSSVIVSPTGWNQLVVSPAYQTIQLNFTVASQVFNFGAAGATLNSAIQVGTSLTFVLSDNSSYTVTVASVGTGIFSVADTTFGAAVTAASITAIKSLTI